MLWLVVRTRVRNGELACEQALVLKRLCQLLLMHLKLEGQVTDLRHELGDVTTVACGGTQIFRQFWPNKTQKSKLYILAMSNDNIWFVMQVRW